MSRKLLSENDVKKALAITDFRSISKEKIMEFASLIPNMDKDVAISIINQFPTYKDFAINIVNSLKDMCDSAMKSNDLSQKETIAAYRKILDDLGELLKKDDITIEEKDMISDKMILVADKIASVNTENKEFISNILRFGLPMLGTALVIGASILGFNIKGKDLPTLKK